jgi:hypothetical protein
LHWHETVCHQATSTCVLQALQLSFPGTATRLLHQCTSLTQDLPFQAADQSQTLLGYGIAYGHERHQDPVALASSDRSSVEWLGESVSTDLLSSRLRLIA